MFRSVDKETFGKILQNVLLPLLPPSEIVSAIPSAREKDGKFIGLLATVLSPFFTAGYTIAKYYENEKDVPQLAREYTTSVMKLAVAFMTVDSSRSFGNILPVLKAFSNGQPLPKPSSLPNVEIAIRDLRYFDWHAASQDDQHTMEKRIIERTLAHLRELLKSNNSSQEATVLSIAYLEWSMTLYNTMLQKHGKECPMKSDFMIHQAADAALLSMIHLVSNEAQSAAIQTVQNILIGCKVQLCSPFLSFC